MYFNRTFDNYAFIVCSVILDVLLVKIVDGGINVKRRWLICLITVLVVIGSIVVFQMFDFENEKKHLFANADTSAYKYGVIYSYHNQDAVVQIYSSTGELLNSDFIDGVRACGLCSSTGKPMLKDDSVYYYVSDAAFDASVSNCILKIKADDLTYEKIDLNMETNYTYEFTIDGEGEKAYAYYSGAPEWGCVYSTQMNTGAHERFAFEDLQGYTTFITADSHFWPLDMVCYEDINYYIGYIVDSYNRKLCIVKVEDFTFSVECVLEGNLYARGSNCIDEYLYFSAYIDRKASYIYRYNLEEKSIDAKMTLDYYSNDIDICKVEKSIVILNCDSSGAEKMRKVVYATKELMEEKIYEIVPRVRIYDFQPDRIICSDGSSIYVYDYAWSEISSFALAGVSEMKFSGIFVN